MNPVNIPEITLICVDTKNYSQAYHALQKSLEQITPARTVFLTDIEINKDPRIECIKIDPIKNKREYSEFIFKELTSYFKTSHCLVIQWDGYVINGESWNPEFLNYDYIGAPWLFIDDRNVGNGGFSIRSKKLQNILSNDLHIVQSDPEDQVIGREYRRYLENKYDIKFPSEELADTFSFELRTPICKTFGFHGFFHEPFRETVIIRRKAAGGDVVALEPVLEYFHSKGFRVALDTLPQFFNYYLTHYFKVYHPQEIDARVLKVSRVINLDMAYELTPKQNHLKSYFEMCGIKDYKLRNPKLTLQFDPRSPENKLFKKYCVIHIDKRDPKQGRNIYGVGWYRIVTMLKKEGFTVIQIGKGESEDTTAVKMNTPNETMLMYIVGGADLFIGIDSGPANIAVAMGTPSILFFGSVTPEHIYPDLTNIKVIQHEKACDTPKCWSSVVGTEGLACVVDKFHPPCTYFSTDEVIKKIQEVINPI
jgi:ADP-heptose:LPS heptosyltransferase